VHRGGGRRATALYNGGSAPRVRARVVLHLRSTHARRRRRIAHAHARPAALPTQHARTCRTRGISPPRQMRMPRARTAGSSTTFRSPPPLLPRPPAMRGAAVAAAACCGAMGRGGGRSAARAPHRAAPHLPRRRRRRSLLPRRALPASAAPRRRRRARAAAAPPRLRVRTARRPRRPAARGTRRRCRPRRRPRRRRRRHRRLHDAGLCAVPLRAVARRGGVRGGAARGGQPCTLHALWEPWARRAAARGSTAPAGGVLRTAPSAESCRGCRRARRSCASARRGRLRLGGRRPPRRRWRCCARHSPPLVELGAARGGTRGTCWAGGAALRARARGADVLPVDTRTSSTRAPPPRTAAPCSARAAPPGWCRGAPAPSEPSVVRLSLCSSWESFRTNAARSAVQRRPHPPVAGPARGARARLGARGAHQPAMTAWRRARRVHRPDGVVFKRVLRNAADA
jgi:hypothetical protein